MFSPILGFQCKERLCGLPEREFSSKCRTSRDPSQGQNQEDGEAIEPMRLNHQPQTARDTEKENQRTPCGERRLPVHVKSAAQEYA
jgi:hypothetical protein